MNYENYLNTDYQRKIDEANKLLNEAKELLSDENINGTLNKKFAYLSTELRGLIVTINEMKMSETREYLEHYNYNELQKSYERNKDDLLRNLALMVDFNAIFTANKEVFLNINEANFRNELNTLLNENETLNTALNELSLRVEQSEAEAELKLNEKLENLDLTSLSQELLRAEITRLSQEAIKDNAEFISKETAEALILDENFLNYVTSELMLNSIFQSRFKMALNEVLESINEKALQRVLNTRELKRKMILHDMISLSLSLQNELKIISENMSFINDYKLIEKRKEFLENLNEQSAKELYENKFKAV